MAQSATDYTPNGPDRQPEKITNADGLGTGEHGGNGEASSNGAGARLASESDHVETGPCPFDLARCVVADAEIYPGRWCVGFRGLDSSGEMRTWIVESRDKLATMLKRIANCRR